MDINQKQVLLETMGIDVYRLRAKTQCATGDAGHPAAGELDGLALRISECELCDLHKTRTQTVFGSGNPDANVMFVGEAPGVDEDIQGKPFVGRAGQLLTLMLAAVGWQRSEVYIANILKCRPPNNRNPRRDEIMECEPNLVRQIELIQPKLIVALGRIAAHNLLSTSESISRLRGKKHVYEKANIPLVVTYHPAYLLRNPIDKSKSWQDLMFIKSIVD